MKDYHYVQCARWATARGSDGKAYCSQHNPDAVAQRRAARSARWDAERKAAEDQSALEEACDALVSLVLARAAEKGDRSIPPWLRPAVEAVRASQA